MVLELAAFRLCAPYFGSSIHVWGSVITVVMVALASGYALGGWVADRSRTDVPLYGAIIFSALYQVAVIWAASSLLPDLAKAGDLVGTLLATAAAFAPPMTALAATGPFLIRLLARSGQVGFTAGKIYAISTAGGIAGALATTLLLIPRFGTRTTLVTACALSGALGA